MGRRESNNQQISLKYSMQQQNLNHSRGKGRNSSESCFVSYFPVKLNLPKHLGSVHTLSHTLLWVFITPSRISSTSPCLTPSPPILSHAHPIPVSPHPVSPHPCPLSPPTLIHPYSPPLSPSKRVTYYLDAPLCTRF